MRPRASFITLVLVLGFLLATAPPVAASHANPFTCVDDASGSWEDVNCLGVAAKCILQHAPLRWLPECWHFLGP